MMDENWSIFEHTGKISDYLKYKGIAVPDVNSTTGVIMGDDNGERSGSEGKISGGSGQVH